MQAIMESLFDVFYLSFAIATGIHLLRRGKEKMIRLLGAACLVLGCGDAFHLVPRIMDYWLAGDFTALLGIGKLVTSLTMTLFYLLLEYVRRERYGIQGKSIVLNVFWELCILRIALCLFPQNAWTSSDSPVSWGIYRNLPFAAMGVLSIVTWLNSAKADRVFRLMWLAILLSFLFYFPVVLWADVLPIIGMMMLPKTCMYIWMLCMFRKASKLQ